MIKLLLPLIIILSAARSFAQNVGIGTNTPNSSAILELKATDKGFLAPRMDSSQRIAIQNPATGLMVYDTNRNALFLFNGTRWVSIDQTNPVSDFSSRPNTSYAFSSPQFLVSYSYPNSGMSGYSYQSASISENLIVFSTGLSYNATANTSTCYFTIDRNGIVGTSPNYYTIPGASSKLYCFDADSIEQNIYVVLFTGLFRINIANNTDITKIADSLGNAAQIKVMGNGDMIISTDLNNGSLIKVQPNGTKQIIASNLRFPNYFDVFNGNYYVTGLSAITGTVKKITPAGVATTIVSDLIIPQSIAFDKNGNFVLQTNITLPNGNVFIKYDMYDANGQLIGPVNDDSDNSILTNNSTLLAPLYIDAFNNLVFMHNGTTSTTYVPNPRGAYGMWVLKLIKL